MGRGGAADPLGTGGGLDDVDAGRAGDAGPEALVREPDPVIAREPAEPVRALGLAGVIQALEPPAEKFQLSRALSFSPRSILSKGVFICGTHSVLEPDVPVGQGDRERHRLRNNWRKEPVSRLITSVTWPCNGLPVQVPHSAQHQSGRGLLPATA